jgi:hypothetical protein
MASSSASLPGLGISHWLSLRPLDRTSRLGRHSVLAAVMNNTFFGDGQGERWHRRNAVSQPSGHSPVHAFQAVL